MAISPTDELLAKYKKDYHADDLDEVLGNIQKYGTDDRSAWYPPEKQAAPLPPSWDRTAFRDAWMGSGVQNVQDMQNWLSKSGWGSQVGTGGSKGDLMYLPSGEIMDTVLAAGIGGNRGGPQWTGRGNWSGGYTPFDQQQQGPQWGGAPTWSQQNYQTMTSGGDGGNWGSPGGPASGPGSSMYDDYMKIKNDQNTQGQNAAKQQQMGMHRQFQSGQKQKQQPNYYQSQQRQGRMQTDTPHQGQGQQQPKYW